ncbi:MAG: hypothetical protein Q8O56_15870 [Solirubrobacteraceae bacterium]|nr:hypothetical protein [Solirubrobacteraceae bacterium]
MTAATRRTQFFVLVLIAVAATLAWSTVGVQSAHAASYTNCKLTEREQQPRSGKPTYNLRLMHRSTRCVTAKRVMNAFHSCRAKTSHQCTKRLLTRWRCTSKRTSSIQTQFTATFTCSWGKRRVQSRFTQFRS